MLILYFTDRKLTKSAYISVLIKLQQPELRSCVKVEVAVLGSRPK